MPQMGFDMKEGRIVRWLKHEGDRVNRGEAIAEVETDKAVVQMEAFGSGVLRKIFVEADQTVPVGTVVGVIGAPDEAIPEAAPSSGAKGAQPETQQSTPVAREQLTEAATRSESQPPQQRETPAPAAQPAAEHAENGEEGEVKASPVARRLAEQEGIDLRSIQGTGPQGRIVKEDVEKAIAEKAGAPAPEPRRPVQRQEIPPAPQPPQPAQQRAGTPAPQPVTQRTGQAAPGADGLVVPNGLSPMRRAIARGTARSMREVPHFYLTMDIDMSRVVAMRAEMNTELDEASRISINDFIIRACVKALQKYPNFNVSVLPEGIKKHETVSISLAVALDNGLIAPGLMELDRLSIPEIARKSKELVAAARSGHLRPEQYTGGNFAVSNLGMFGVTAFTAIITQPHAAALAVGKVEERPVVRDGKVVVAQMMSATLSSDHRAVDGAQSAQFMAEVKRLLEKPTALLV